jgi:glycosyltransferase involved in cell wall biosynthesis
MTPKRLLFVAPDLVGAGGAERQTLSLLLGLRELGNEVALLTLARDGDLADELRAQGVRVECARLASRMDVTGWRRALRAARSLEPQIVVSRSVSAQAAGHVLAARLRVPHVTVEHAGPGLALGAHRRALVRWVARSVSRVVAVSPAQIPGLRSLGYPEGRIRVIPNGVALNGAVAASRAELGLEGDDFVAVLAAALRPEKQVPLFVRAVARAAADEPRIHGLVAGAGVDQQAVEQEVARSNGAVRLLGRRSDVPALLEAADVVCLSSAVEAAPLVLVEAMAAGRPVLATRVGGVPDLVGDGVNGVLVPAGDERAFSSALVALARDPERARRLGDMGRTKFRERFTLDRMVEAYDELFDEVLAEIR